MKPCIVLQTDFGLSTGLPASMNAVIDKIDPEIKIYYEFMDFYKLTDINYIWFYGIAVYAMPFL